MELDPRSLTAKKRENILLGCVVPRPIALISTISPDGAPNLAPYSYFTAIGHFPMGLLFCSGRRADMSEKDSTRNARPVTEGGTGEFVVNMSIESYIQSVAAASESIPYGKSEFELTGLTTTASQVVQAPRVAESPVAFECRTSHVVPAGGFNVVIGEVVHVFVRDDLLDEHFHINFNKLSAIGRMGGTEYCRTQDRFELQNAFVRRTDQEAKEYANLHLT